jgi:hypothetical protein
MFTCTICNTPTLSTRLTMDAIEINYTDGSTTKWHRVCNFCVETMRRHNSMYFTLSEYFTKHPETLMALRGEYQWNTEHITENREQEA